MLKSLVARVSAARRSAASVKDSAQAATKAAEAPQSGIIFAVFLVHTAVAMLTLGSRFLALGALRPTLLLDGVLWCWWLTMALPRGIPSGLGDPWGRRIAILFVYALVSVPFVKWPGSVLRDGIPSFLVAASFLYFCIIYCTTWQRLRLFVLVWMACQVFRVLQPIYLHIRFGYWGDQAYIGGGEFMHRLSGAPGDVVNPNGLGFIVASVLPFFHYLVLSQRSRLMRLAYPAIAICLVYGLILTGSRSALIAVVIDALLIAWRSKARVMAISIIAVGAVVSVHLMSANLLDRYDSLINSKTENARTEQGRINGLVNDFELGLQRPVFGFGLGTSEEANWNYLHSGLLAHDVYEETLIELGFIGLCIYLSFLASLVSCVSKCRTELARAPPTVDGYEFMTALSSALRVWVPMALIFFFSQYGLRELDWYIAAGMAGSLYGLLRGLEVSPSSANDAVVPKVAGSSHNAGGRPRRASIYQDWELRRVRSGAKDKARRPADARKERKK